jgi:hypothetical protein
MVDMVSRVSFQTPSHVRKNIESFIRHILAAYGSRMIHPSDRALRGVRRNWDALLIRRGLYLH